MSTKKSHSAKKILDRIKYAYRLRTDTELANYLGVSQSTIPTWKSRDTLNRELIIAKCDDINANWIFHGEEPIFKKDLNKVEEKRSTYSADDIVAQLQERADDLTRRVRNLNIDPVTKIEMIAVMIEALEIGLQEAEKKMNDSDSDA